MRAVAIMLNGLDRCFAEQMKQESWQRILKEIFPSFGKKLNDDAALLQKTRNYTQAALKI